MLGPVESNPFYLRGFFLLFLVRFSIGIPGAPGDSIVENLKELSSSLNLSVSFISGMVHFSQLMTENLVLLFRLPKLLL